MALYVAPYRIPFCSEFTMKNNSRLVYEDDGSGSGNFQLVKEDVLAEFALVWSILPNECQISTIVIAVVGAVLLLLSLIFNIVLLIASFATKPRPPENKDEKVARKQYAKLKDTLLVGSVFKASLSLSGVITCGLLLPFIGISGYELLFSSVSSSSGSAERLTQYKNVACAFFHIVISSAVYSMLGAVIERWITIFGLNPKEYLERKRKPTGMPSPTNKRRNSSHSEPPRQCKSHRKSVAYVYVFMTWMISIGFGVASVLYGKVRLLLFGEDFQDETIVFSSNIGGFINIPTATMLGMTIVYIACLYIPFVLLVMFLAITLCYLLRVRSKAENLESYDEACFRSEFGKQQVGASNQKAVEQISRNGTPDKRRRHVDAEYSHKLEHTRQIAMNCQHTGLHEITTDCIQIENDEITEQSVESDMPPPPEWIQYPSIGINRLSTISTVQVPDLAQPAESVSVDSARAYFGETSETKTTLVYCATTALFLLPLCALLAFDIFSGANSIFRDSFVTYFDSNSTISEESLLSSYTASSLGIAFFVLFVLGTVFPFIIIYNGSPPFRRGTKRVLQTRRSQPTKPKTGRKTQRINKLPEIRESSTIYTDREENDSVASTPIKRTMSVPNGRVKQMNKSKWSPQPSWVVRRSQSLSIDQGWHPQMRPFSSTSMERMTIDERYEMTELKG